MRKKTTSTEKCGASGPMPMGKADFKVLMEAAKEMLVRDGLGSNASEAFVKVLKDRITLNKQLISRLANYREDTGEMWDAHLKTTDLHGALTLLIEAKNRLRKLDRKDVPGRKRR